MRTRSEAFPVGLYGMLLFALGWLTFPAVFEPVERVLVGIGSLVPRVAAQCFASPVHAAVVVAPTAPSWAALRERIVDHDLRAPGTLSVGGLQPWHCAVTEVGRLGGGRAVAELRLERSHAELAGCSVWVTKGDRLLGVWVPPGNGPAATDQPEDAARVLLLNHPDAPAQFAGMTLPDGRALKFVVRAAASVDPAPLRIDLWDDPYLASQLDQPGIDVWTRALPELPEAAPAGLRLGTTRLWGYSGAAGAPPMLLGVFVDPGIESAALSHVVLWRATVASTEGAPRRDVHGTSTIARHAAVVHDLPGNRDRHHLLVTAADVVDGAAVVDGDRLLGTARAGAFGVARMTGFAASHRRWNLLLLPTAASASPLEFAASVVHRDGDVVWLRLRNTTRARLPEGELFTGSNGPHCPAGLHIGRAGPHATDAGLLEVVVEPWSGPMAVDVLTGGKP